MRSVHWLSISSDEVQSGLWTGDGFEAMFWWILGQRGGDLHWYCRLYTEHDGLEGQIRVCFTKIKRYFQLPNRKDSSQICPVTLSEINESCNAETDTGLIKIKQEYDGLNEVIKEIDIDGEWGGCLDSAQFWSGSGLLEFTEFCHLASWFLKEEDETMLLKELKEAFRIYDKDEEGWVKGHWDILLSGKLFSFISTNSLKEILKELDSQLSEEELEGIIEEVDTDGSGTLDFDGKENLSARISDLFTKLWKCQIPSQL